MIKTHFFILPFHCHLTLMKLILSIPGILFRLFPFYTCTCYLSRWASPSFPIPSCAYVHRTFLPCHSQIIDSPEVVWASPLATSTPAYTCVKLSDISTLVMRAGDLSELLLLLHVRAVDASGIQPLDKNCSPVGGVTHLPLKGHRRRVTHRGKGPVSAHE